MTAPHTGRVDRGRSHSYLLDGEKVDGVTKKIGDGCPKPAITNWATRSCAEYVADNLDTLGRLDRNAIVDVVKGAPFRDRDAAANRGTQVHNLGADLAHGYEVDVPDELVGHVDSYLRWCEDWDPKFVHVEKPVFSRKHRYAGTFDFIADIPAVGRVIGDLKTNRSGPFGEVALQLAAYRYADFLLDGQDEIPMAELGITGAVVVWLTADGYQLKPVQADESIFRTFLYVQQVAWWTNVTSKEVIGDPLEASR